MSGNKRDLKAYVRVDGSHRVVPTSLVLRKNKPKVGKWIEVEAWECCNGTTTTTTSTTAVPGPQCATYYISVGRSGATLSYTDCEEEEVEVEMSPYAADTFCALEGTVLAEGDAIVFFLQYECSITTTTTTAVPTTTTTTTAAPTTTTTTTDTPTTTTTTTTPE